MAVAQEKEIAKQILSYNLESYDPNVIWSERQRPVLRNSSGRRFHHAKIIKACYFNDATAIIALQN